MARQMVINYGMSDIGPWSLLDPSAQSGDVVMRMMARNSMSENLQQRIDEAVKEIATEAYTVALKHIKDNRCASADVVNLSLLLHEITCVAQCTWRGRALLHNAHES